MKDCFNNVLMKASSQCRDSLWDGKVYLVVENESMVFETAMWESGNK
jgi:hypothetical protein